MSDKRNFELEAVKLLRTSNEGVLTTISDKFEGYPFGSFITYITDRDRSVIIFASNLAEHTTNCLLYTSPSPRDRQKSRMPSSA